jgi:hypothetical protein
LAAESTFSPTRRRPGVSGGPLVAEVKRAPSLSGLQASQIGVIKDLSAITRGPFAADATSTER